MEITYGAGGNLSGIGMNMTPAAAVKTGPKPAAREAAAAKKVAQEFEALFAGMMLKSMRETVGKDKLTNGGHGEEIYRSLLDQEYARVLSENGALGLTAMLERQLVKSPPDGTTNQGVTHYDTSNQSTKTEVTYEN